MIGRYVGVMYVHMCGSVGTYVGALYVDVWGYVCGSFSWNSCQSDLNESPIDEAAVGRCALCDL